ncbi:MAG: type II toxin-antitoxin system HicA family toxin [Heliobacteriaceae bacterium]|nr:type II toxin-antitoxin system HicA family toxin [Heliobacteriaceae bacterium]
MKSYSSREIIKILINDGWYHVNTVGDHHHFKHPTRSGKVTVTHPKKDVPLKTVLSIFGQAGIKIN